MPIGQTRASRGEAFSYPAERKRIDIGDYYSGFAKVRAARGWESRVGLRAGLTRTIAFYREPLAHYV